MSNSAQFRSTYQELQERVEKISSGGEWRDYGNHEQYRAPTGAILNWWTSTGTVCFQGPPGPAEEFQAEFDAARGHETGSKAVRNETVATEELLRALREAQAVIGRLTTLLTSHRDQG